MLRCQVSMRLGINKHLRKSSCFIDLHSYVTPLLIICGLFICKFAYIRLRMIIFYRTYPLIYSHHWTFYMRIRIMRVIFYGPYLSHIMRSACIHSKFKLTNPSHYCCFWRSLHDDFFYLVMESKSNIFSFSTIIC